MESSGVDRISSLGDDVLLKIIGLLPSAADAVRTGALSTRWIKLWTRAPGLRLSFNVPGGEAFPADCSRVIAIINSVLDGHQGATFDDLEISFLSPTRCYLCEASLMINATMASQVQAWLRQGMERAVKSFTLKVRARRDMTYRLRNLELPASARAETISLNFCCQDLSLPAPREGAFHALTDLEIAFAVLHDGERLGRLVSSPCCPRLRRLRLLGVTRSDSLSVASDTLEELTILEFLGLSKLEVNAPILRVLHMDRCCDITAMAITAPGLEVLACSMVCQRKQIRFDSASSVRRLEKISLWTHTRPVVANRGSIWLLRQCTGLDHLGLILKVPRILNKNMPSHDDAMRGMPELSNIRSLRIDVCTRGHLYESSLENFLAWPDWDSLEYLQVNIMSVKPKTLSTLRRSQICKGSDCVCHERSSWEYEAPLPRLKEVKITGVSGTEDDTNLVNMLFEYALELDKMTVEFSSEYEKDYLYPSEDEDDEEVSSEYGAPYSGDEEREDRAQQLILDAPCARGNWIYSDNGVCEWKRIRDS